MLNKIQSVRSEADCKWIEMMEFSKWKKNVDLPRDILSQKLNK